MSFSHTMSVPSANGSLVFIFGSWAILHRAAWTNLAFGSPLDISDHLYL